MALLSPTCFGLFLTTRLSLTTIFGYPRQLPKIILDKLYRAILDIYIRLSLDSYRVCEGESESVSECVRERETLHSTSELNNLCQKSLQ